MKKESSGILRFLYNTVPGRMVLKIITSPTISKIGGAYMDCRVSKIHIKGFIKNNNIDMTQYEKAKYGCFNDCFTRKIWKKMHLSLHVTEDCQPIIFQKTRIFI